MKKTKPAAQLFLIPFLCFSLMYCICQKASASASDMIDPENIGSITLTIMDEESGGTASDGEAEVYRIAGPGSDKSSWVCTDVFAGCEGKSGCTDSVELAETLVDYAVENRIAPDAAACISDGSVSFSDLPSGVYLVVQTGQSTGFYSFCPFLATIPQKSGSGWIYQVDCTPKVQIIPIPGEVKIPEETEELKSTEQPGDSDEPNLTASAAGFGSKDSVLPQTGQLNWPVPVMAVLGICSLLTGTLIRRIPLEK